MYVPTPTYGNHLPIIKDSGLGLAKYRYYDAATGGLDFAGMKEDIQVSPTRAFVLASPRRAVA